MYCLCNQSIHWAFRRLQTTLENTHCAWEFMILFLKFSFEGVVDWLTEHVASPLPALPSITSVSKSSRSRFISSVSCISHTSEPRCVISRELYNRRQIGLLNHQKKRLYFGCIFVKILYKNKTYFKAMAFSFPPDYTKGVNGDAYGWRH